MIQPPTIINAVQESATSILIYTRNGRSSMYIGGTPRLLGFTNEYVVVHERDYVKIYQVGGSVVCVIYVSGMTPLRVSGNTIIIQNGDYYNIYDMRGNKIDTQRI